MTDRDIAHSLLAARRTGTPTVVEVTDAALAYRVQALVMAELGPIGGWKVGAAGPDAPPSCAPMPEAGIFAVPHVFDAAALPQREIESEIAFVFAADLLPRSAPYTVEEALAAIATCHPGVEILQSRLETPGSAAPLALLADLIQHGAYLAGPPIDAWRNLDFDAMRVVQTIDGAAPITRVGNPAGDMLRLMVWLANEGAVWAGGIKAGQIVTCGSWTGKTRLPEGASAVTRFDGAPEVHTRFAPR
jgi:2-keto-4-pentenoate hydratase